MVIENESLRSELEATWKDIQERRESVQVSVLANFTGLPSRRAGDYAFNLVLVLAFGALQDPALDEQGRDSAELAEQLMQNCRTHNGSNRIPDAIRKDLRSVGKILNIEWIERGIDQVG